MRTRLLFAFVLVAAMVSAFASNAFGVETRQLSPAQLQHVGFESGGDTLPIYPYDLGDSTIATATWGPITNRHSTGSRGLWCAGSVPADWPFYQSPTRGQAVFSAGDTSHYYQSWIQYSYIEPSYGALENINPFRVDWIDASSSPTSSLPAANYGNPFLPITPVWTTVAVPRDPGLGGPPATPGYFRFNFFTSANDTATAEGATIDDVYSLAYKYGPVGSLVAARKTSPHSAVTVSWTAAANPSGGTPYYLVWRHDIGAGTWTQVTPSRITSLSVTDTGVAVNRTYEYAVQAWDGAVSTSDWGPLTTSAQVAPASTTSLTGTFDGSQTTTTAPYLKQLRISGTLSDVDGVPISGQSTAIVVQISPDNSTWTPATALVASAPVEVSAGSYTATITVSSTVYSRLSFGGANGYSASRSTPGLLATLRVATTSWTGMALSVPTPKYHAQTNFSATLHSETGLMPGRAGQIELQTSPDGVNSWTTSSTALVSETGAAVYSATLTITSPVYCRLRYAGDAHYQAADSTAYGPITYTQNTEVQFDTPTIDSLTPGTGGTVAVGANLSCETGAVVGRGNVFVDAWLNGLKDSSTSAVEDVPGHYTALAPVPDTHGNPNALRYQIRFVGDSQYAGPVTSAYTPFVTPKPANNISFGAVTATPTAPVSGGSVTVSADLQDASAAPVHSADASVALQSSPNNSTWTTLHAAIVDSPAGHYSATATNITAHTYFRFIVTIKTPATYDPPVGQIPPYHSPLPNPDVTPQGGGGTDQVNRLAGDSRYTTAIAIGEQAYPNWTGVHDVVIASGDNKHLPDALTAAGLAGAYNGPVLLVAPTYLDQTIKAAIQAMPSGVRVHIVGGTPSVSASVMSKIAALSHVKSADRIFGSDRYATAAAVATRMKSVLGASLPHTALLTTGADSMLLDPLIASTASAYKHYPVLLVARLSVPSPTSKALTSLGLTTRYVVGGPSAVDDSVMTSLGIPSGNRISGADIAGDAAAFATRAKSLGWLTGSAVGFAAAVPDAATGGALMGKLQGPMLLVSKSSIPQVTTDFLTANKGDISVGYLFGGTPTVDESVRTTLVGLIN